MATLRQLRTRVASITNIQKVTNAMFMVAAAKMRRAQEAIESARPYAEQLDTILRRLQGSIDPGDNPLFVERPVKKVAVVVVTADRGLCGGFNGNISRRALAELKAMDAEVELITVGRKGKAFLRSRGFDASQDHEDIFRQLQFSQAVEIAQQLTTDFVEGRVDKVLLVFSEFRSVALQEPVVHQLLPIAPTEGSSGSEGDYIFEPEPEQLLDILVPRHVNFQVWRALLESNAGFYAAQMTSMDNATKNAGDLIDELTREMNKARQSAITLELMDIIGGAEAVAS
ncbi:MAG: ATP synthase F1 subunit gamma [Gemmatimonadetes bacterium]|nr:ATP synthase F1 subunit gamma [Gemmatimonadota bacterium]MBT6146505.1 ATP synthase F1 subunit gamma [Gemmatimonadota bacterium]